MNTKQQLRDQTRQTRHKLADREGRSERICQRLFTIPNFTAAQWVLFYVHVRSEVQTSKALMQAAALGKNVAVPYCVGEQLHLFHWQQEEDLAPGTFGILEPRPELLADTQREVAPTQIDVVLVPGLVFDPRGHRLGYGKGYYDRLLADLPATTTRIGLAFDCQLVDCLPQESHDQQVDWVVTESKLIDCRSYA